MPVIPPDSVLCQKLLILVAFLLASPALRWRRAFRRRCLLDLNTGPVNLASESPVGRALRQSNNRNFALRLGLAWRLPDLTRPVLRMGHGIFSIEEFGGNGSNPIQNPSQRRWPPEAAG